MWRLAAECFCMNRFPFLHFGTPMWDHLHDVYTNRSLQKTFDLNLLDGMKAYLVILMKMWWILPLSFWNEACSISDVLWIPDAGYNELICIWMHGWADKETSVFTLSRCVFLISYNYCKAVSDMEISQMKVAGRDFMPEYVLTITEHTFTSFFNFQILTC